MNTYPRAANEAVNIWMNTGDRSKLLQSQSTINFAADAGANPTMIVADENINYQPIDVCSRATAQGWESFRVNQ